MAFPLPPDFKKNPTRTPYPRQLIIYNEEHNTWMPTTDENIVAKVPYLAVSYRQSDFPDKRDLERSVHTVCGHYRLRAYWLDYKCTGATKEEKNMDLYRIADVFRGAEKTLIMIAGEDDRPQSSGWLSWGDRIWTLPEALLSPFDKLCYQVGTRFVEAISLRRAANAAYKDREEEMMLIDAYSGKDIPPLTEKIELLRKAIWKRSSGPEKKGPITGPTKGGVFTAYPAERVYALMGFLQYRIIPDPSMSEEEAFARLMEANHLKDHKFSWDSADAAPQRPQASTAQSSSRPEPAPTAQSSAKPAFTAHSSSRPNAQRTDFDTVIDARHEALRGSRSRDMLSKLALSLKDRFEVTHDRNDLDEAIECEEEAVRLTPEGHADKPRYYFNLGVSYQKRFDSGKRKDDVDKAILNKEKAVILVDDGDINKAEYCSSLGLSLQRRFTRMHDENDIKRSVEMSKEAVRLTPNGHRDRLQFLSNLASALTIRYERKKTFDDLDEAIRIRREIVNNAKYDNKKLEYIIQLSDNLFTRFNEKNPKVTSDLDEVTELRRMAVDETSESNADKPRYLESLALAYRARYSFENHYENLNQVVEYREHAVRLLKDGEAIKPEYLNNLATSLSIRFFILKDKADFNKAIAYREDAIRLALNKGEKNKYTDLLQKDLEKRKQWSAILDRA